MPRIAILACGLGALGALDGLAYATQSAPTSLAITVGYLLLLGSVVLSATLRAGDAALLLGGAVAAGAQLFALWSLGGPWPVAPLLAAACFFLLRRAEASRRPGLVAAFALAWPYVLVLGRAREPVAFGAAAALVAALPLVAIALAAVRRGGQRDAAEEPALAALCCAVAVLAVGRHLNVASSVVAPDELAASLAILALLGALVTRRRRAAAALFAGLLALASVGAVLVSATPAYTDQTIYVEEATRLALRGTNPYREFDGAAAIQRRLDEGRLPARGTELATLEETRFVYPAGALAFAAPAVALGVDIRTWYLLELLALALVVFVALAGALRIAGLALLAGSYPLLREAAVAGSDPGWALAIAASILTLPHPLRSGAALGVAAAIRQLAWWFAPFLLLRAWHERGLGGALRAAVAALAVFVAFDAWAILDDPGGWAARVVGVAATPYRAYGVGLVRLEMLEVVSLGRAAFTLLAAVALLVSIAVALAALRRAPRLATALPLASLFLAWRNAPSYFVYAGPLALLDQVDIEPEVQELGETAGRIS